MSCSVPCSTRRQAVDFHLTFPVPTLVDRPARAGRVKGAKRRSEPLTRLSTLARFGGGIGSLSLAAAGRNISRKGCFGHDIGRGLCQGQSPLYYSRRRRKILSLQASAWAPTVGFPCCPTVGLTELGAPQAISFCLSVSALGGS